MKDSATTSARLALTLVLSVMVLVAATGVAAFLIMLRKPPQQTTPPEPAITVELARMFPEDVPVIITGFGEARPLETVPITPQVAGRVDFVHDRLFVGEIIPKGDVLFTVDARDYEASVDQARAQLAQARSGAARLKLQHTHDKERLATLRRNSELAQNEFQRLRTLLDESAVGALANVERAELTYNQALDGYDAMRHNVELYPARIEEAEQAIIAAEAALSLAETMLERTIIQAPFHARIKEKQVERGQYISPGTPILALANDATIEIIVPLDSRDARSGLRFKSAATEPPASSWFSEVEPIPCRIYWTEEETHQWTGQLDRIVDFNEITRTVHVAVRISSDAAQQNDAPLPLVEGMFCRIEMSGQIMEQVYRLPRNSVTFENQVYVVENGRLHPRTVTVARTQNNQAFIDSGISAGDLIVTTRLVDPLPGTLVQYKEDSIVNSAPPPPQSTATSGEPQS